MTINNRSLGNILGATRAEADTTMLERAFVETTVFATLTHTQDFNFVVGRRGTGKSALCTKLTSFFQSRPGFLCIKNSTQEHETIEFQSILERYGEKYNVLRTISRMSFKIGILLDVLISIKAHHKFSKSEHQSFLAGYLHENRELIKLTGMTRSIAILRNGRSDDPKALAAHLAAKYKIEEVRAAVQDTLKTVGKTVVVLYDGLDEGWLPEVAPTATLGGLAKAISELAESGMGIYPVLFIRDNMYRALGEFDGDFTRHIEGNTTRLHWDEASLLRLVAQRLRVALSLEQENDIKVWNRFAQRKLEGREGFRTCLQYTLYRPRDILTLLNDAYQIAQHNGRDSIIESDVDESAVRISKNRLDDLIKEYDKVLPGIKPFIRIFSGSRPLMTIQESLDTLNRAILEVPYSDTNEQDFAIFEEAKDIFYALYSVGFFGVKSSSTGAFTFCHDGSLSSPEDLVGDSIISVHPCYWKALGLNADDDLEQSIVVQVNHEYDQRPASETAIVQDLRVIRLGTVADELPRVRLGNDGSADFEKWIFRAIKVLFAGKLSNPELSPNSNMNQRKDVIATTSAESGFWLRIRNDYSSKQVLFQCVNSTELSIDEFEHESSPFTAEQYGRFSIICTRSADENLSDKERAWVRAVYQKYSHTVMIIPAEIFSRCLRKLRNANRNNDYTEDALSKRMDWINKSVLNIPLAGNMKKFRKK